MTMLGLRDPNPPALDIAVLTPVWGERYITEFAEVGFLSLLSRHNLELVCERHNVELVFLTTEGGRERFEGLDAIQRAKSICSVRYLMIDDLITSANYGVTLTLAFARAIKSFGERQTSTAFIFFNSDFVLSDGSLSTVVQRLEEGYRCIMAPSLRVNAEVVFPALSKQAAASERGLEVTSRSMVELALRNLHLTVVGRTLNQDFVHCAQWGQFYWRVDEHTLIAAHHLIFMMAIAPEKPLGIVNSYVDYCFVPEMVPSGQFALMDDSDEFFMIELQAKAQEREMLRCGHPDVKGIYRDLSEWTTAEHRRFAQVPVVFHAKDIPPQALAVKEMAQAFVESIQAKLVRMPVNHAFHDYWTQGVAAWIAHKRLDDGGLFKLPPELQGQLSPRRRRRSRWNSGLKERTTRSLDRLDKQLFGVPIWHHRWCDTRAIDRLVKESKDSVYVYSLQVVESCPSNVRMFTSVDELAQAAKADRIKHVVLHVLRSQVHSLRTLLTALECASVFPQEITVFIDHLDSEFELSNFSFELAQYASDMLPDDWLAYDVSARFTGGSFRHRAMRVEGRWWRLFLRSSSRLTSTFAGTIWLVLRILTTSSNVWSKRNANPCPQYCSSAMLTLRRRRRSQAIVRESSSLQSDNHMGAPGEALV
ncbi:MULTISPECIES: hypothetical protein [unclassified Bradyrhizobium]|uniref:hypothetical protein n=1 Tax=unclassified Bradyrhizobium TaxID=2631580 RepID=UPI0029161823|nr:MULTISPECIES: hypothetical protein [unclassified Bradyrhizobium]